ncbi:MAG: alpha/beta fold hydrolase [Cyanobacteria bacterium J06639_1]
MERRIQFTQPLTSFTKSTMAPLKRKQWLYGAAIAFLAVNGLSFIAAYHMTHVREPGAAGLGVPKPQNRRTPGDRGLAYSTHRIEINDSAWLEMWQMPSWQEPKRGIALLFHGNLGTKSGQLIGPGESFAALGYEPWLIDFQGSGGSSGTSITIGMREARDVVTAFEYAREQYPDAPIVLYGVSMGSAAVLRAISKYDIDPNAIVLELPFTTLVDAVKGRLNHHNIPASPIAEMVVFWGGLQHGFNGFGHNPKRFAKDVNCPALVIHGEQDKWMTVAEIERIFQNLPESSTLVTSPEAGHHQLIGVDRPLWEVSLANFLNTL